MPWQRFVSLGVITVAGSILYDVGTGTVVHLPIAHETGSLRVNAVDVSGYLFLCTDNIPDTYFGHIALEPAGIIIRLADEEHTVRRISLNGYRSHTKRALRLQHAVDIYFHLTCISIVGHGHMLPALGQQALVGVIVWEVSAAGRYLNLIVREACITDTHKEVALNTHDGRDELAEFTWIDECLHRNLVHISNQVGGLPVYLQIVLAHVSYNIDERTCTEHKVIVLG